jgi:hypothetical protein
VFLRPPKSRDQHRKSARIHEVDGLEVDGKVVIAALDLLDDVLSKPGGVRQVNLALNSNDCPAALWLGSNR